MPHGPRNRFPAGAGSATSTRPPAIATKPMKLAFAPFSILLGLAAGIVGRKIFEQIWGLIDKDEPPHPQHRETGGFPKLLAALVLEGAIFRLVRGLADHGSRHGVAKVPGAWQGAERPEAE
jgi:hypothetical protein